VKTIQQTRTYNHSYTVKCYEAEDGTVFDSERECLRHDFETFARKRERPLSAGEISHLDDEHISELLFLKAKEDFDYIVMENQIAGHLLDTDFFECGSGWYLYWSENGGDCADSHYIMNYDHYLKKARRYLEKWVDRATKAIAKAERV